MRLLVLAAGILLPFFTHAQHRVQKTDRPADRKDICEQSPAVVAKCFVVHGRLSFYNGAPSARIWKIGTKRILGVHNSVLPGELGLKMGNFNTEAFGDFRVCPLTREQPGVMQIVCIASAKNVHYKKGQ